MTRAACRLPHGGSTRRQWWRSCRRKATTTPRRRCSNAVWPTASVATSSGRSTTPTSRSTRASPRSSPSPPNCQHHHVLRAARLARARAAAAAARRRAGSLRASGNAASAGVAVAPSKRFSRDAFLASQQAPSHPPTWPSSFSSTIHEQRTGPGHGNTTGVWLVLRLGAEGLPHRPRDRVDGPAVLHGQAALDGRMHGAGDGRRALPLVAVGGLVLRVLHERGRLRRDGAGVGGERLLYEGVEARGGVPCDKYLIEGFAANYWWQDLAVRASPSRCSRRTRSQAARTSTRSTAPLSSWARASTLRSSPSRRPAPPPTTPAPRRGRLPRPPRKFPVALKSRAW